MSDHSIGEEDDVRDNDSKNDGTDRCPVDSIEGEDVNFETDMAELEEPQPGVQALQPFAVTEFQEAAALILQSSRNVPHSYCTAVPDSAPWKVWEISYLLDLHSLPDEEDIYADCHGSWGHGSGKNAYYKWNYDGNCFERIDSNGRLPPGSHYDRRIVRRTYSHPVATELRKIIYRCENQSGNRGRWALISYQWSCTPYTFTPKCHGNKQRWFEPFQQPVRKSVKEEMKITKMARVLQESHKKWSYSDSSVLEGNKRFAETRFGRKYRSSTQTPLVKICRSTYSLLLGRRQPCRKIPQKNLEFSHRRAELDFPGSRLSYTKFPQKRMLVLSQRRARIDSPGEVIRLLPPRQLAPVVKRAPRFEVVPPPEWDSFKSPNLSPVSQGKSDSIDVTETLDDDHYVDVHPEGVTVFRDAAVVSFQEALEITVCSSEHPYNKICTVVPPRAPFASREAAFLVDTCCLMNSDDVKVDEHGSWGKKSGKCAYYKKVDSKEKFKKLDNRASKGFDVKISKSSYRHPATDWQLHKVIFIGWDSLGQPLRWALVSYLWTCKPFFFTPLPHGNSTVNFKPFQPTRASVKEEMKDLLKDEVPSVAMARLHSAKGYENVSPAERPRNVVQLHSMSRNMKRNWNPVSRRAWRNSSGRVGRSAGHASGRTVVRRQARFYRGGQNELVRPVGQMSRSDQQYRRHKFQLAFPGEEIYFDDDDGDEVDSYDEDYDYYYDEDYDYGGHTVVDRPVQRYSKVGVQRASHIPVRRELSAVTPYELNSVENVSYNWAPVVQGRGNSFEFIESATHDYPEDPAGAEDYPEGVTVFQNTGVCFFEEAVEIMLHSTRHLRSKICTRVPPRAPLKSREAAFLVDTLALMNARDVLVDEHGSWGHKSGKTSYYIKQIDPSNVSHSRFAKLVGQPGQQIDDFDVKMLKWNCRHPATDGNLHKVVFMAEDSNRHPLRWALVSYLWTCDPFSFTPLPHGNSRKNFQPYQPTRPSAKQQIKNLLKHQVPSDALANFHSSRAYESPSQAEMPRDIKQMYNFSKKVKGPRQKWQKRFPDRRKDKSSGGSGERSARTDGIYPGGSHSKAGHKGRARFSHGEQVGELELERAVEGIASTTTTSF